MKKTYFSIICTSFFLFLNAQKIENNLYYLEITNPAPPVYPYLQKPSDASIRFQNLFYETLVDDNKQNNAYESRHINIENSKLTNNRFSAEYIKGWMWNDGSGAVNINDIVYSLKEANKFGVFSPFTIKNVQANGKNIILELGSENLPNNKNDIIDRMRQVYVVPNKSSDDVKYFEENPSGTGPFGWGEYDQNKIFLEAGLGEWSDLGAPNIDRIIIEEIPLILNHWTSMQTNEKINLMVDAPRFARQRAISESREYKLKPFASDQVSFLLFNYKKDIFDEKGVRLGIDLSIDKETLAKETFEGDATVISGPFSSQSPYYDPKVTSRKKDIKEAKRLLNNSLTKNGDYFEVDGKPVSLLLIYNRNITDAEMDAIDQIKENLKEIGFKVTTKSLLAPSYRAYLRNGRFDIAYYSHQYDRRSFAHTLFASNKLIKQNGYPDLNYGKYNDKTVDVIVGEWTKARDRVSKNRIGKDFHKRLNDEVASIFLFSQKSYAIHRTSVEPIIVPYYFFGRPHEWAIENK